MEKKKFSDKEKEKYLKDMKQQQREKIFNFQKRKKRGPKFQKRYFFATEYPQSDVI